MMFLKKFQKLLINIWKKYFNDVYNCWGQIWIPLIKRRYGVLYMVGKLMKRSFQKCCFTTVFSNEALSYNQYTKQDDSCNVLLAVDV